MRAAGRLRPEVARRALRRSRSRPQRAAGEGFHQCDFERYDPPRDVDAIVASRSLHHVDDPAAVAGHIASALRPGGAIVVVEWAWERFNEKTRTGA